MFVNTIRKTKMIDFVFIFLPDRRFSTSLNDSKSCFDIITNMKRMINVRINMNNPLMTKAYSHPSDFSLRICK